MPNKVKRCFDKVLTFDKMMEAHERAKKGKMSRYEVLDFELNIESNIVNLVERISKCSYKVGNYRRFTIYEPKKREIKALPYIDRVVHQWYVHEFIKKYIVPKFIKDTFACIDGRGTHAAVDTLQKYMRIAEREFDDYYILKMDIKKYFYNIDHGILYKIMRKYIGDKKLLSFTKLLIENSDDNLGIPIGNFTSQFFTNIYLSELDRHVKQDLKVKYYVRYMDDFVLLVKDKMSAKIIYNDIERFINIKLKLSLNSKSRYYPSNFGADFCGYRIWNTHKLIRNKSRKKIKRKIAIWNKLYYIGKLTKEDYLLSFNSWLGHIKHADSYNLKISMIERMKFISNSNTEYKND